MIEEFKEFVKEFWLKFVLLFLVLMVAGIGLGIYTEKSLEPKTHTVSTMYVVKEGDTLIDICYTYQQLDYRKPVTKFILFSTWSVSKLVAYNIKKLTLIFSEEPA